MTDLTHFRADEGTEEPPGHRHAGMTLGGLIDETIGAMESSQLLAWPPDVFALTSLILERTEAYRLVVSPPPGECWPPDPTSAWSNEIVDVATLWSAHAAGQDPEPPTPVGRLWHLIMEHAAVPLKEIMLGRPWSTCVALLTLHALADQACIGIGTATDVSYGPGCAFRGMAREHLAEYGTLSRISTDRARVLPKDRFASGGITLRSLSRNLGVSFSQVDLLWMKAPKGPRPVPPEIEHSTILLLPWPPRVASEDFRPTTGPLSNMDRTAYGFFEFQPRDPIDLTLLHDLLHSAISAADRIDAVVMPECALEKGEVEDVEDVIADHGIPMLVAGVRRAAQPPHPVGENLAQLSVHTRGGWRCYQQAKHHRWMLDGRQIGQYRIEKSLDPDLAWWEAIEIPPRSVQIIEMGEGMTVVPLVCEDLARYDGATDLLRAFGPALVVTLLLDGPQLASRWTCRYAGVLSDDPGSSVLTLTSLGMALRSVPEGRPPSRVVGLWNDRQGGLRQLELAPEHDALLLRTRLARRRVWTADGRRHDTNTDLALTDVTQIKASRNTEALVHPRALPRGRTLEGMDHVDLTKLTGWIESIVEAALGGCRDDVEEVLRPLHPSAPWRQDFDLPPPQGNLAIAFDRLARSITSHLASGIDPVEALGASASDLRRESMVPLPLTGRTVAAVTRQRMASMTSLPATR